MTISAFSHSAGSMSGSDDDNNTKCHNFDITLNRLPQDQSVNLPSDNSELAKRRYQVRLHTEENEYSPLYECILNISDQNIQEFLEWVITKRINYAVAKVSNREPDDSLDKAVAIGKQLFEFIFTHPDLNAAYKLALKHARDSECKLRIRLILDAPELQNLPWEYLNLPSDDENVHDFFTLETHQAVSRYLIVANKPTPPTKINQPLRIVCLIGAAPTKKQAEWLDNFKRLERVFAKFGQAVKFEIPTLETSSFEHVQDWLRTLEPFHVVHYVGHGEFETGGGNNKGFLKFKGKANNSSSSQFKCVKRNE